MTTILDILGTSTPVSEILAKKLGYVRAAIACRIFFYQQLENGLCNASITTLADKLGMSTGAVSTNLTWLREQNYIISIDEHKSGNVINKYKVGPMFYYSLKEHSADESNIHEMNDNIQQMNGKEESKEESKEYMGASAESLDDFFGPKSHPEPVEGEIEPTTTPKKSLAQRIKEKDPELLMAALGITAKENSSTTEQDLHRAGWHIGNENIRRTILDFLEATGLPIPAKPARGAWLKHAREHLEEFTDLEILYTKAWKEYKPQIDAGMIDITHPGALTKKMRAILQRKPEPKPNLSQTNIDMNYYKQLLEQEKTRNGNPS